MPRPLVALLVAALAVACGASPSAPPKRADASGGCSPRDLGLAAAAPLVAWKAPPHCRPAGGRAASPVLATDEEALRPFFTCDGPLGVDLTAQALVVSTRTLSPAYAGGFVVDDGKKVTFVTQFRAPCPGDPRPMPMESTAAWPIAAGAPREFAEATCTVARACE